MKRSVFYRAFAVVVTLLLALLMAEPTLIWAAETESVYEIATAEDLYAFAELVNSGNNRINGKLIADIIVNENVLNDDFTLNGDGSDFRTWTPIGNEETPYCGTFDGAGHNVSGLYFSEGTQYDTDYMGLIGYLTCSYDESGSSIGGIVKNVTVADSYLEGNTYLGGIAGAIHSGRADNCHFSGVLIGTNIIGGITGECIESSLTCSSSAGKVLGECYLGGVVGKFSSGESAISILEHCFNTAIVRALHSTGGIVGYVNCLTVGSGIVVADCYNIGNVVDDGLGRNGGIIGRANCNCGECSYYNCYYLSATDLTGVGSDSVNATITAVEAKVAEQFASGEVAYLLNNGVTDGTQVWYQTLGTDTAPVFAGGTIYSATNCLGNAIYGNVMPTAGHSWVDVTCTAPKTCTFCGETEGEALGHSYDPWRVEKAATCTEDGAVSRTCSLCKDKESVPITATGHSDTETVVPPTCTQTGYTTHTCTVCGDTYVDTYVEASGHNYESIITIPTCTEAGYTTHTCRVCGDMYIDNNVDAPGHSYEDVITMPTCTEVGYTTHTCTSCGDVYVDTPVAASGHSYGGWAIGKLPTCEVDGYMVRTCGACQSKDTSPIVSEGHTYVDGICTACGDVEVVIPTITPKYPSLNFEDEVYISVYFQISDMTDVVDMGLVVSTDATVDENDTLITEYDYKYSGGLYGVRTHGIPAKSLGETLYFKVYAKLSDGSYVYSGVYNYSALDYAKDRLANSSNENLKKLCVAMLNYGAAAQTYMGYNVDTLANATLTAEQLALVDTYNASMVEALDAVDSGKVGVFTRSGFGSCYPSISFEGAFGISYYFTPTNTPDNGMKLYYWDKETYDSVEILSVDNAGGVVDMTLNGTAYKGAVEGIAAKEVDETLFVAGVYEVDGVTYTTGILPYSLGAYCVDRAANGSEAMKPFAEATAVYGYYAKTYFAG